MFGGGMVVGSMATRLCCGAGLGEAGQPEKVQLVIVAVLVVVDQMLWVEDRLAFAVAGRTVLPAEARTDSVAAVAAQRTDSVRPVFAVEEHQA